MISKIAFTKKRVLVVDDEIDLLEIIEFNLEKEGFIVKCVKSGEEALKAVISFKPDVVILDLMLPGIDGYETCKAIRQNPATSSVVIIMLTAKGEDSDIITGLEIGADDYIVKPFSPKVLIARIRATSRKQARSLKKDLIKVHSMVIDPNQHSIFVNNKKIDVTANDFELLLLFASEPGQVFTRQQIIESLRGENYAITERAVDVQIVGLRRKLGKAGKYIETIHGVGYRFVG